MGVARPAPPLAAPNSKRQRLEFVLEPEDDFLQKIPGASEVGAMGLEVACAPFLHMQRPAGMLHCMQACVHMELPVCSLTVEWPTSGQCHAWFSCTKVLVWDLTKA